MIFDQQPPKNLDAERDVLGSILLGGDKVLNDVREIIKADDFYDDANKAIFEAMIKTVSKNEPLTVLNIQANDKSIEIIKLADMQNKAISPAYAKHHARHVKDASVRRSIIRKAVSLHEEAFTAETPVEVASKGLLYFTEILNTNDTGEMTPIRNAINPALERIESRVGKNGIIGIPTGFSDIDILLGGWQCGYYILGGRPSMGKTSLGLQFAANVGIKGFPVAIYSLEMPKEELAEKLLALTGQINSYALRNPTELTWAKLSKAAGILGNNETSIYINDKINSITKLEIAARKFKSEHGNGLIMIDYLQLIDPEKYSNTREETTRISKRLMHLKLELGLPILALSQLSREVEGRKDKRPILADLRESGSLEQDADVVMFTHREDYYDGGDQDDPSTSELIIRKNRMGKLGTVNLMFFKGESRFTQIERRRDFKESPNKSYL